MCIGGTLAPPNCFPSGHHGLNCRHGWVWPVQESSHSVQAASLAFHNYKWCVAPARSLARRGKNPKQARTLWPEIPGIYPKTCTHKWPKIYMRGRNLKRSWRSGKQGTTYMSNNGHQLNHRTFTWQNPILGGPTSDTEWHEICLQYTVKWGKPGFQIIGSVGSYFHKTHIFTFMSYICLGKSMEREISKYQLWSFWGGDRIFFTIVCRERPSSLRHWGFLWQ